MLQGRYIPLGAIALLLLVCGASAVSVHIAPTRIQPGDAITVTIAGLPNGSAFTLRLQGQLDVTPGAAFDFKTENLAMPFRLDSGHYAVRMENTQTNRFRFIQGGTEVTHYGVSTGGVYTKSGSYTFPAGLYDLISLSGTALPPATYVVSTFEVGGTKQGADTSAITFSVNGMTQGTVKVTVIVDGNVVAAETIQVDGKTMTGKVTIRTVPTRANVYIDGQYLGLTPIRERDVPPGTRTVLIQKAGYSDYTTTITIVQGRATVLGRVLLTPVIGNLRVRTVPSRAQVFLDSVPVGRSPLLLRGRPIGPHSVRVEKAGYATATTPVTILGGRTSNIKVLLTRI